MIYKIVVAMNSMSPNLVEEEVIFWKKAVLSDQRLLLHQKAIILKACVSVLKTVYILEELQ